MILAALALAVQSAQPVLPSENVTRAATHWGACNGARALEFARGPDPLDAVVAAVQVACRDTERTTYDEMVRAHGADLAREAFPMMRENARNRIRQTVREARGLPRERGRGDEALAWGECLGRRSAELAAGTASADEIVEAALTHCVEFERAVHAWAARQGGEATAVTYMEMMRRRAREATLQRIAEARAPH